MTTQAMPQEYLAVLILFVFGILFAVVTLYVGRFFSAQQVVRGKTDRL